MRLFLAYGVVLAGLHVLVIVSRNMLTGMRFLMCLNPVILLFLALNWSYVRAYQSKKLISLNAHRCTFGIHKCKQKPINHHFDHFDYELLIFVYAWYIGCSDTLLSFVFNCQQVFLLIYNHTICASICNYIKYSHDRTHVFIKESS